MKSNLNSYLIHESESLGKALVSLNENKHKALVVIGADHRFIGCLTDGDIRRALVNGHTLESLVVDICNKEGRIQKEGEDTDFYNRFMKTHSINFLPLTNKEKIVDIVFLSEVECDEFVPNKKNPVVIMAGGLGSRLGDLTKLCPKPMLEIGGKPILEHILLDLRKAGFQDIYISVNYLSEVIENYFKDGSSLGLNIEYIKETKRLGTAGSLFYIKDKVKHSFLLMNADIYSKTDFAALIEDHEKNNPYITVCTRNYQTQIPFGVLTTEGGLVVSLQEKPVMNYEIGAGIYALSPQVLDSLEKEEFLDMPEVINIGMAHKKMIKTFSLCNTWHDIGQVEDYKKVQELHGKDSC